MTPDWNENGTSSTYGLTITKKNRLPFEMGRLTRVILSKQNKKVCTIVKKPPHPGWTLKILFNIFQVLHNFSMNKSSV